MHCSKKFSSVLIGLLLCTVLCQAQILVIDTNGNISQVPNLSSFNAEVHVAIAQYNESLNTTGWNFISIYTSPNFQDDTQANFAGILEGYLTQTTIDNAYWNFIGSVMNN
jgi:hypothetical protein